MAAKHNEHFTSHKELKAVSEYWFLGSLTEKKSLSNNASYHKIENLEE